MSRPAHRHPMLISTGVRASQTRTPDRVAITDDTRAFTFTQLVDRFDRAGSLAKGLGLKRGDHVALMSPNCIECFEIVCGMADMGVAAAMVSPQATPREVSYICNDSQARVLFVHATLEDQARAATLDTVKRIVVIGGDYEALLSQARPIPPDETIEDYDTFCIPYTSGTTGEPKGVLLSHRARVMHMLLSNGVNTGCYQPSVKGLAIAPFFNGAGFVGGLAPMWFGGTVHVLQKFEAETTLKLIADRGITAAFFVPTHFHAIFNLGVGVLDRYDVSSLRVIISGAAALPQDTKERIVAHFGEGRLFEGYGSTEAGGISSLRPEDQLRKQQCVGLPLTGVEMRILDDDGKPVPRGEIGEIVCRNSWLFSGYWNKEAQTAEVLRDGWYYSGDLGRQDEEGYLYVVDRKKNVIITGGQNVFPREIEEILYHFPGVAEAAIIGKKDAYWGEAVTAYLVTRPGETIEIDALKAHLSKELARYKLPKSYRIIDKMPMNGTGKILHRELKEWADREVS